MAQYVYGSTHELEDGVLYLNGRPLSTDAPLELSIASKTPGEYNIDFLLENIDSDIDISTDDEVDLVITDAERIKSKLIQLVAVPELETISLHIGEYTVNITLVDLDDDYPIYIPNIQTTNETTYFSNGVKEYPSSNFDLPLPIASTEYIIGWLDNNKNFEIGTNSVTAHILYNQEIFSIPDDLENQMSSDSNRVNFTLDPDKIKLKDMTESNYYLPVVFEFVNKDDIIVSSRSVLFVRMNLYLQNEWKQIIETISVPVNTDKKVLKSYVYHSVTPDTSILVSPYIEYWNDAYPGISNLSQNQIKYGNLEMEDELICSVVRDTNGGQNINIDYGTLEIDNEEYGGYDPYVYTVSLTLRTTEVDYTWQSIKIENLNTTPTVTLDTNETEFSLEKYKSIELGFTGKNIAKVEVLLDPNKNNNIDKSSIPEFTIDYTTEYIVGLPNNGVNVYPIVKGNVTIGGKPLVNKYDLLIRGYDCEGTVLCSSEFTLDVYRPKAIIETDFDSDKKSINIDKGYTFNVTCKNVYNVTIREDNFNLFTPKIENIVHSEELQESGTYEDYSFDLVIEPLELGISNIVLSFADDQDDVVYEVRKAIDIFTTVYSPVNPNVNPRNIKNGLDVKVSYKERKGYNLPLAFVNNGEEAEYILVAKYPISQDTMEDKLSISKGNRPRLEYIPESFVSEGVEEGQLYKVANPDITKPILKELKEKEFLNNAIGIGDSVYLDTMLANLNDAHYQACISNMVDDSRINWFYHARTGNMDNTIEARAYYPELPLHCKENSYGGTWVLEGNYGKKEYAYGILNNKLDEKIDIRDNLMLPFITTGKHFTHNGQINGIVEPFGFGVKTYSDVRVRKIEDRNTIELINPMTTDMSKEEKEFTPIEYDSEVELLSISNGYIGPNDYPLGTKVGIYYGNSYDEDKQTNLLDNIGFPKDTMLMDNEYDETFKGNKGYTTNPHSRYGDSVYRLDLNKITEDKIGYIVSGNTFDGKLVDHDIIDVYEDTTVAILDDEEVIFNVPTHIIPNPNENHISNLHPEAVDGSITGTYRSRMLIDGDSVYQVNNLSDVKNDQIYFNSRLHFLLFDNSKEYTGIKIDLESKWLELEIESSIDFNPIVDEDTEITLEDIDTDLIQVSLEQKKISSKSIIGNTTFTLIATKGDKVRKIKVHVNVTDIIPLTDIEISADRNGLDFRNLDMRVGDTFDFTVLTTAASINAINSDYTVIKFTQTTSPMDGIACTIEALAPGDVTLYLNVTAKGYKPNQIAITINVREKIETIYTIQNSQVEIPTELLGNSIRDQLLSKATVLLESTLEDSKSIAIWSPTLAGRRFTINEDYSIDVDFGIIDTGEDTDDNLEEWGKIKHQIYYACQIDAKYEQNGIILDTEPVSIPNMVENNNNIVRGMIEVTLVMPETTVVLNSILRN